MIGVRACVKGAETGLQHGRCLARDVPRDLFQKVVDSFAAVGEQLQQVGPPHCLALAQCVHILKELPQPQSLPAHIKRKIPTS